MAKKRTIPLMVARGIGGVLGIGVWIILYQRFTASLSNEILEALRLSSEFGTLMGVSAAFMVLGTLALSSSLTALVLDRIWEAQGKPTEGALKAV